MIERNNGEGRTEAAGDGRLGRLPYILAVAMTALLLPLAAFHARGLENTADTVLLIVVVLAILALLATVLYSLARHRRAAASVAKARDRLRDAIESIPQAFKLFDADDRLVLSNGRQPEIDAPLADILLPGVAYEDIVRAAAARGVVADAKGREDEWIAERMAWHRDPAGDFEQRMSDGRWIRVSERRTREGGIVCIRTDITEAKQREEALRDARETLRAVIDTVPAAISAKDRDLRYSFMNRFQADFYGIDAAAVVGKTPAQVYRPEHGDCDDSDADRGVFESGEPVPYYEEVFPDRDGALHTWMTSKLPLRDAEGRISDVLTVSLDITERKQGEDALRRSEHQLRLVTDSLPVLIAYIDRDERFRYVNATFESWHKRPRSDFIGLRVRDIVGEDDYPSVRSRIDRALAGEQVNYERTIAYPDGVTREVQGMYVPDFGADGDVQGFYLLIQDATEHKRAEKQLRESRMWLENAQRRAKLALWDWTFGGGGTQYWSPQAAEVLGVPLDDLYGDYEAYLDLVHPDDRATVREAYRVHYPDDIAKASGYDIDYRILRPDGSIAWINEIADQEVDASGRPARNVGTIQDITERKQAEAALRESERQLENAQRRAKLAYWVWSLDESRMDYWSPEIETIVGVPRDGLYGTYEPYLAFVHPDDRDRVRDVFRYHDENDGTTGGYDHDYRLIRPDGSVVWVHEVAEREFDDAGRPVRDVGTIQDITERKLVEEALELTQFAVDHASDAAYWSDSEGRIVYANEPACAMLGYTRDELQTLRVTDIDPDATRKDYARAFARLREQGALMFETRHVTRDGRAIPVEVSINFLSYGDTELMSCFSRDITERKQAEAALRESEARLRNAQRLAQIGYWTLPAAGAAKAFSPEIAPILGVPVEALPATRAAYRRFIHPDDRAEAAATSIAAAENQAGYEQEYRIVRPDGGVRHIHELGEPMHDAAGEFTGMRGTLHDITERKQIEEALREAEAGYREIFEQSPLSIWEEDWSGVKAVVDRLKRRGVKDLGRYLRRHRDVLLEAANAVEILQINQATVDIYGGKSKAEVMATGKGDQLTEAELQTFLDQLVLYADGAVAFAGDVIETAVDDSEIMTRLRAVIPPDHRETWSRVITLVEDITERRRAEEAPRESERSLANAQRIAHIGDWESNLADNSLRWSEEIFRIFGVSPEEFGGDSEAFLDLVLPDDVNLVRGVDEAGERGEERRDIDYRIVRPDGSIRVVHESAEVVFDDDGRALRMVGTLQDITERKQAEAALRESDERLRAFFDNSPAAVSLKDIEGRFIVVNRQFELNAGLSNEEIRGKTSHDIQDKTFADAMVAQDKRIVETGEVVEWEQKTTLDDGDHTYLVAKFPVRDATGEIVAIGGISTDITERKRDEQFLRTVLDTLPAALNITDTEGRIVLINRRLADYFQIDPKDVIGKLRNEALPSSSADEQEGREFRQVLETGIAIVDSEYKYDVDGREEYWLTTRQPIHDAAGRLQYVLTVANEITERKQAEQLLRTIVDTLPAALNIRDTEGRFVLVNRRLADYYGLDPADATRVLAEESFPQSRTTSKDVVEIRRVIETGTAIVDIEDKVETDDGEEYWLTTRQPIRDAAGRLQYVLTVAHDITVRKQAEEALRRSEARLRRAQRMARVGHWDLRPDGVMANLSPEVAEILGVPSDRIPRTQDEYDAYLQPDDSERIDSTNRRAMRSGEPYAIDYRIIRPDGEVRNIHELGEPQTDESGRVIGITSTIQDVTERKQAEAALIGAKEQAELANRTKSEFLANMSHELRTPLNAIIGFSDMIRSEIFGPIETPEYREYIDAIGESGAHLLAVINDILDISKIEASSVELSEDEVDVRQVIDAALTLVTLRAQSGEVTLKRDIGRNLPLLRADEGKVKQILINLLSNAVKFTPSEGTVRVRARLVGGGIEIAVKDTGIGIAPEDIGLALEPFGQVDSTLSRRFEGTGLGLPLVKSMIELHGGSLRLDSELGVGTTVTVVFPPERVMGIADAAQ